MSLPITLAAGQIAVYGTGYQFFDKSLGIPFNNVWVYGVVHQVYDGGGVFVYAGDIVMFNKERIDLVNYYNEVPYTFLQARLVTTIVPPP